MGIYKFENCNKIFALGDCGGKLKYIFDEIKKGLCVKDEDLSISIKRITNADNDSELAMLRNKISKMKQKNINIFANCIFVITGDCGIGLNKGNSYEDLLKSFNKILSYNNTHIIFIRGNYDNPSYFDGETINMSNIKAIPDYSVINAIDKNILCIGGAVSVDRVWKKKQEERINKFSINGKKILYCENEAPVFNKEAIDEIVKSIKIDYVISHTAPSFVNPQMPFGTINWAEEDSNLLNDIQKERVILDRVYEALRDNGMRPKYWVYGHFDMNSYEKRSDTLFRSLNGGFSPVSIIDDVQQLNQVFDDETKKKHKLKMSLSKNATTQVFADGLFNEHQFGAENADNNGFADFVFGDPVNDVNEQAVEQANEMVAVQPYEQADEPARVELGNRINEFRRAVNIQPGVFAPYFNAVNVNVRADG